MSGKMDYDKSEPNIKPVLISIFLSLVVIFILTFGVIFYFQTSLSTRENQNVDLYGKTFDLKNLNEYENNYLEETSQKKVNINEAINFTINNYSN